MTEALIPDAKVYAVNYLRDMHSHLTNQQLIPPQQHVEAESALVSAPCDFRETNGQEHLKRVLEIAAAGRRKDLEGTDNIECHRSVNLSLKSRATAAPSTFVPFSPGR